MLQQMKQFGGWYFPDQEEHLISWMTKNPEVVDGHHRYQGKKIDSALSWCKQFRVAVDVGSHIGLWSYYLAQRFLRVYAFEPVAEHRDCFMKNVGEQAILYPIALGERKASVSIHTTKSSSGDTWVNGEGDIPMNRLDNIDLWNVDFIKLDCEGYELFALRGAEETLRRCKPCVIVEQKPGKAQKFGLKETEAVDYLQSLGAKLRARKSGDFILSWD